MEANEILKDLRESRGLTMKEVSEATQMATSLISDYETGKKVMGMKVAVRFADFYNVSLDYLLGRETINPFMKTKDILKELRKNHSLSMKEFCKQCDISFNTYQNYETGKRIPTAEILVKIADFYGVTTDYLLGRATPDPIQMLLSNVKAVDSKKFVETYQELPDLYQSVLVDAMKRLSEACTAELPKNQRHVERLGDIEDARKQEEQAKGDAETSCA